MVSRSEALASLNEADMIGRRVRLTVGYGVASPHLILWGIIWFAGYAACGMTDPSSWGVIWLPLVLAGAIAATLIGMRARAGAGAGAGARAVPAEGSGLRSITLSLATAAFFVSVYWVFRPAPLDAYLVFPALVTALIYVIIGSFGGTRFGWIGAGMFIVSMAGYLFLQPWLPFVIAVAGGGGLVLGGVWLRKI